MVVFGQTGKTVHVLSEKAQTVQKKSVDKAGVSLKP